MKHGVTHESDLLDLILFKVVQLTPAVQLVSDLVVPNPLVRV